MCLQKGETNWFPGSAWEPISRGSASLGAHPRQSLSMGIPRQSLGTSKTVNGALRCRFSVSHAAGYTHPT